MIGAIIGDIIGSRFEFDNLKSKDFELFTRESSFTDDSVLTIACMDWLLHSDKSEKEAVNYLKKWTLLYPHPKGGYGGRYIDWIFSDNPKPYKSYGNGSAMRISPVGFYAKNEKEAVHLAEIFTSVTHNHPEGIKGGVVEALSVFYLKNGKDKEFISSFINKEYNDRVKNLNYEKLVKYYDFEVSCQKSVPEAFYCFLISKDFEDCMRTAVSIGGDTDTICAISGALADAFYGVPKIIEEEARKRLTKEMLDVIDEFELFAKTK